MSVTDVASLGEFLSAARARLDPDDIELDFAGRRRVPGLRREEIAMLAGVSTSYYTRLEQGQSLNASSQVIDALARALRLGAAERDHLHRLAQPQRTPDLEEPREERIDEGLSQLLQSIPDTPAIVLGRCRDILGWNAAGHELFAAHIPRQDVEDPALRPNAVEQVFLDAHTRELYVNWHEKARSSVGHLRILASRYRTDRRLLALIGRLTVESADFREIWNANEIKTASSAVYSMRHPVVGQLEVTQQLLTTALAPDQTLILCTTPAGSPSRDALCLLTRPD